MGENAKRQDSDHRIMRTLSISILKLITLHVFLFYIYRSNSKVAGTYEDAYEEYICFLNQEFICSFHLPSM